MGTFFQRNIPFGLHFTGFRAHYSLFAVKWGLFSLFWGRNRSIRSCFSLFAELMVVSTRLFLINMGCEAAHLLTSSRPVPTIRSALFAPYFHFSAIFAHLITISPPHISSFASAKGPFACCAGSFGLFQSLISQYSCAQYVLLSRSLLKRWRFAPLFRLFY